MSVLSLLVIATALTMLACGPQAQQPTSTGAESQPRAGGILNMRETVFYHELDPTMALRGEARHVTTRAFDSLLDVKSGSDQAWNDVVYIPRLAERWEVSPDGKKYTFQLRKGVKFANLPPVNGRELTSADVKWSLEYIARIGQFKDVKFPKSNQIQSKAEGLDRVETPDPYTAVVYFKEPFAPFLTYSAMPHVAIMPHEVYDQDGKFSDNPIGSGPWQYDKAATQSGVRMVYKKNPDYWQPGKPFLDEVRTIVVTEENAAAAAFQTKQIDILDGVELKDGERLLSELPGMPRWEALGWNASRFYYNVNIPPFNDVRFRRAMSFATDRDDFVRTFTKGKGEWGMDGAIPGIYTHEEVKKLEPYDPEEAKRLLRESGYVNSPITIETLWAAAYGEQLLNDIQLLQAQWKKVGIDMKIVTLDRTDLSNRRRNGDYMMAPTGAGGGGGEPEPDFWFYGYFHPKSGTNYYQVKDAKLTEYAEAQRREVDPAKRRERWREQAKYVHENGFALWIYYTINYGFRQPYVKGYYPSNFNGDKPTTDTWLDK